jgi:hypothetical protein
MIISIFGTCSGFPEPIEIYSYSVTSNIKLYCNYIEEKENDNGQRKMKPCLGGGTRHFLI